MPAFLFLVPGCCVAQFSCLDCMHWINNPTEPEMNDRNEYHMHTRRVQPVRQHYAQANAAPRPRVPTWAKLLALAACIGLGGALEARAQTVGVHVAHGGGGGVVATPGAYVSTGSGIVVGVIAPQGRASSATVYAGASADVLTVGPVRVGVEGGVSHRAGRPGAYVVLSARVGGVRLMWSPVTRMGGLAVEF